MGKKTCFVVMPISDVEGYELQHFGRVYEYLIKPACIAAGLTPVRADDVKSTNHIVLDILTRIVSSDLVLCDLSAKNANVMYELGIRQAFDLPVVLLKDKRTERVFDIQGLRTLDYDETLRVDRIAADIKALQSVIENTLNPSTADVNSLVKLLSVAKATVPQKADISADTAVILQTLGDISRRITKIEEGSKSALMMGLGINPDKYRSFSIPKRTHEPVKLPSGATVAYGTTLYDSQINDLGKFAGLSPEGIVMEDTSGSMYIIPPDDDRFRAASDIPF